jgi:predicted O-methyltransferase YrrM
VTTLQQVRDVREKLLERGVVVAGDAAVRRLSPVAIGPGEGRALAEWVRKERALATLETGLGFAVATLFICESLLANGPEGRHVAADPYQLEPRGADAPAFAGVGLQILEEAGVRHLVEFHPVESQIALPRLLADGRRFDLAFLDGNHRFEGVFLDLVYSGRLVKEGGIVFVDDTQLAGVRRAVEFCVKNLGWVVEDDGAEGALHEWMVLRTGPADAFARPFDAFVDFQP